MLEKSTHYLKKFKVELYGEEGTEGSPMAGGLIQQLIGDRTSKTKPVVAVFDPREHKVVLPSQLDLATTERFI